MYILNSSSPIPFFCCSYSIPIILIFPYRRTWKNKIPNQSKKPHEQPETPKFFSVPYPFLLQGGVWFIQGPLI